MARRPFNQADDGFSPDPEQSASAEELDLADRGKFPEGHRLVLLVGARGIGGRVGRSIVLLKVALFGHPCLDLIAADIGEHVAVDLDAGGKRLTAALLHFPAEGGVLDDVLFLEGQVVFAENGADAFAPATEGFQVGGDLRLRSAHAGTIRG